MARSVLITGVSRYLGGMLAHRLESDPSIETIVGVDLDEPFMEFERVEVVRADIRNPLFVKVLQAVGVDTVVHTHVINDEDEVGRNEMKELNVIGTMQLLAACQKVDTLEHIVLKSSTEIYGAEPGDPAYFTEEMGSTAPPKTGYHRDVLDAERYAREFGRSRPDVGLTILRFAHLLGTRINNPLSRYLSQPLVPTLLGYDPRMTLLHEDDAIEIMLRAIEQRIPGIFNAVADDAVYLSKIIREAGRLQAPVLPPVPDLAERALKFLPFTGMPAHLVRYLAWGRGADNTRLKTVFGYEPRYTAEDAIADFALKQRAEKISRTDEAPRWEDDLRRYIDEKVTETGTKAEGS